MALSARMPLMIGLSLALHAGAALTLAWWSAGGAYFAPPPLVDIALVERMPPPTVVIAPVKSAGAHHKKAPAKSETVSLNKKPATKPVEDSTQQAGTASATPYFRIKPRYPKAALVAGVSGEVDFAYSIRPDGHVENIRVLGGRRLDLFQYEARRALEQWRFRPATNDREMFARSRTYTVNLVFDVKEADSYR